MKPYKLTYAILQSKNNPNPKNVNPISIINPIITIFTQAPPKTNKIYFSYLIASYFKFHYYNTLKSNLILDILQSISLYQE